MLTQSFLLRMPRPEPATVHPLVRRYQSLVHDEIWRHDALADVSWRGRYCAFLRVLSITVQGVFKNKIFIESAALAYYTIISLGPIVTLAIIISSFFVQKNGEEDFATPLLSNIIMHVAPTLSEYNKHEEQGYINQAEPKSPPASAPRPAPVTPPADTAPSAADHAAVAAPADTEQAKAAASAVVKSTFKPELLTMINTMIKSARSGKMGALGLALLVFICIQLIISIENTFNSIWGVRRGRSLMQRVIIYWAIISLGTLVGFAAGTLLSVSALSAWMDQLPWGLSYLNFHGVSASALLFLMVTLLLAGFYRFMPNTAVRWKPALLGGVAAALFLTLNNYLSFLYISKVISASSLYGSIGIFPMLLFGLYIFWLLILLGGQLTFALQNADYLTDDRLWNQVSPRVRRLLSLAAFLHVARAFLRREEGPNSAELAERLRVPGNLLNECLTRLCDLHLLSPIETPDEYGHPIVRYQPGRALERLTLGEFHHDLDDFGNSDGESVLHGADPVVRRYLDTLAQFETTVGARQTFGELLANDGAAAALLDPVATSPQKPAFSA